MNTMDLIRNTIDMGDSVVKAYLNGMTDEELMLRPSPKSNHIAWQLGHLVASENEIMSALGFEMPALPEGFAQIHDPENVGSDDPSQFRAKGEYIKLSDEQRAATLAVLDKLVDADLDKPSPAPMNEYAPTWGAALNIIGLHMMMHAGQFVPVRRELGKPIAI